MKEGNTDKEKAAILVDLTYCLLSNKPTFNWGKSANSFIKNTKSIIETSEYDYIDLITSMDPD